ncbi:hypothetical protein Tco_1150032 [Tanacetum coccineum]
MKEAISLMGRSESVFGMTSNTVYQLPSEPSRQEEFEDLVINFILNQEEKVRQLEEYISVIGNDFMQLSLEVVFSTWMAFGGDMRDLGSFGEETDKITNLHQFLEEVLLKKCGDAIACIKRHRRDPSSDGVRDLVMAS